MEQARMGRTRGHLSHTNEPGAKGKAWRRMTNEQYMQMLANGSKSLREVNAPSAGKVAIVEHSPRDAPLGTGKAKEPNAGRVLVRVTSVRKRLLDEDNICEKFHVDLCRYSGMLRGDEPDKTAIQTTQRKAGKEEEEHTMIEIFDLE